MTGTFQPMSNGESASWHTQNKCKFCSERLQDRSMNRLALLFELKPRLFARNRKIYGSLIQEPLQAENKRDFRVVG